MNLKQKLLKRIIVVNNSDRGLDIFKSKGYNTLKVNVEDIVTRKWMGLPDIISSPCITFVSPANSLLYMDGGIDKSYMRMFRGIEEYVQNKLSLCQNAPISVNGRKYLPVGCSMVSRIDANYDLISAPTMLLPQPVTDTQNAYYAMKSILKVWDHRKSVLLLPLLACGFGLIPIDECEKQVTRAIDEFSEEVEMTEYHEFYFTSTEESVKIIKEQPNYDENKEFKGIYFGQTVTPNTYYDCNLDS